MDFRQHVRNVKIKSITGSNFNNDRTTFHQPDFTTSALSKQPKSSGCIATYQIIYLISA